VVKVGGSVFRFISKQKFGFVAITLIALLLNFTTYAEGYEQGLNYLKKAKSQQKSRWKKGYLEKAYQSFIKSNQKNARLLQVYTGILISKSEAVKPIAARFVINYRTRYILMIADLEILNLKEKKKLKTYMLDVEEQIPHIDKIDVLKKYIYPFRGDTPGIRFALTAPAAVVLKIDGSVQNEGQFGKGTNSFTFEWKNTYMDKNSLDLEFNAANDLIDHSRKSEIIVDLDLPHNLSYYNGNYSVRGENFRNETKVVKRIDIRYLLGVLAGAAIGVLLYLAEGPPWTDDEGNIRKDGVKNGLTYGGLIGGISLIGLISNPKHVSVPHKENIRYNRELTKQIERLKKEVKVNLRIKNEG
jgi:hypothetical protein